MPIHIQWQSPTAFVVAFERRDDGGLRVTSNDVPGLILSAFDPAAVIRDLHTAIDVLTRHNINKIGRAHV